MYLMHPDSEGSGSDDASVDQRTSSGMCLYVPVSIGRTIGKNCLKITEGFTAGR